MSNTIELKKSINSDDLEEKLKDVWSVAGHTCNFKMGSSVDPKDFGTFPQLILLFFTWLRNTSGDLILDIDENNEDALKRFSSSYFGYTILSSAWIHRRILSKSGSEIKSLVRPHTRDFYRKIDFLEGLPNDSILIPLFDHYSKERGLSHWFYDQANNFYGSSSGLENSIYRIFKQIAKIYKTRINQNTRPILDDLATIIWELVGNTHFHARKDYLNEMTLSPNVRGLYIKIHRSTREKILKDVTHHGLKKYYESVLENGENFFLEISVFDAGPGLVKRFMGGKWSSEIDINEEIQIIKKCLAKGVSSADGVNGRARGYGLNNVLRTLSEKRGFLKIRSGDVSLYRDLVRNPHLEDSRYDEISLFDWQSANANIFSKMTPIEGTSITMSYPLVSEK